MSDATGLRLMAVDAGDLQVISAACQDGLCKPADLVYEAKMRRFRIELNRYRWETTDAKKARGERVRSVLSFESVENVKVRGLPAKSADLVLSLLSVDWKPGAEEPEGEFRLMFSGDGELVIKAECLDVLLADTSPTWSTRNRPEHD